MTIRLNLWLSSQESTRSEAIQHLQAISDPKSRLFGQYWDPRDIVEHFAPPSEHVRTVARWLNDSGIPRTILSLSVDRTHLAFDTTLAQAQRILKVKPIPKRSDTGTKNGPAATEALANLENYLIYHLPDFISEKVELVVASAHPPDSRGAEKNSRSPEPTSTHLHHRPLPRDEAQHLFRRQSGSAPIQVDCRRYMSPDCLRQLYHMPALDLNDTAHPQSSLGIWENAWMTWVGADLDRFFTSFQPQLVGHRPIIQSINGGHRYEPANPSQVIPIFNLEANLDFQYAISLAYPIPVTNIQVGDAHLFGNINLMLAAYDLHYCRTGLDPAYDPVYPDTANAGLPGAYNSSDCGTHAVHPKVIVIPSTSDEANFSPEYAHRQCDQFLKLALQGTTILAAAGDYGTANQQAQCLDTATGKPDTTDVPASRGNFASAFPASCPWVTAVGGTWWVDSANASSTEEAVFRVNNGGGLIASSSGGFSNVFERPFYQTAAAPKYLFHSQKVPPSHFTNLTTAGKFNPEGRGIPDVSSMARNFLIALNGSFFSVMGTSAAMPVLGAMVARINDARFKAGKGPVGFMNPVLYHKAYVGDILRNDVVNGGEWRVRCRPGVSGCKGVGCGHGAGDARLCQIDGPLHGFALRPR
ncbi:Peptidase S8/S53 domain containing protein [Rhypophila sp. PSN 637]